ncbi:MAG: translation initiation factor IF-3 [Ruminococcaceae bacterium]|nr:translation initiation factor IF-3 [Oscillospiraceae bacterium]
MINEQIRDKEVRLVDTDGSQLGIVSIEEAMQKANDRGVDLVKIAPQAKPPVCKIMDYGKYKFELAKRDKEARKNQKTVTLKEIRLSPSIDTHDFETKVNHTIKFLKAGDKVKITVRFRGREMNHSSLGKVLLERFAEAVSDAGTMEKEPKMEGRNMFMVIAAAGEKKADKKQS